MTRKFAKVLNTHRALYFEKYAQITLNTEAERKAGVVRLRAGR
jgi:hypothetical protein